MPFSSPQAAQALDDLPLCDLDKLSRVLSRYVRGRTSNLDVVEDVVQETLVRLVQITRREKPVSIYALGFRIAANLLVDQYRQQRRYADEPDPEQVSEVPLPDRVIAGRQELTVLSEALAAMPPLRREVLVRRRIDGQSCATIARELELSPKSVEKHITRGLADLQRAMSSSRCMEGSGR